MRFWSGLICFFTCFPKPWLISQSRYFAKVKRDNIFWHHLFIFFWTVSTRTYIFTVCRLSGHTIWFHTYRKYTTLALLILSTQGTFSFPLGNSKTGSVDTRDIAAMTALFDCKDSENSWLATLEVELHRWYKLQ